MRRPGAKLMALTLLWGGLLGIGFWGLEARGNEDALAPEAPASPRSEELGPRTVNSPRIVHPGWEYGNCTVPGGGAVEVFPEEAVAHGGRVFDKGISRYYSLPNGRCMVLTAAKPFPDWVPEWMEKQPPPPPRPTMIFVGTPPPLVSERMSTPVPVTPTATAEGTATP